MSYYSTPGRLWVIPDEPAIEFEDTPIYNALFYRHFPIRWVIGAEVNA